MTAPNAPADDAAIAAYVDQMAQLLDLPLPEDIRPQVVRHFAQIQAIAQPVLDFELSDQIEPAPIFRP